MPRKMIKRTAVGICSGLIFGLIAVAVSEAGSPGRTGPVRTDCNECHESVVEHWEISPHGQALDNPLFQELWQEKNQPSECLECHTTEFDADSGEWSAGGVSCVSCHTGQTGPHPETAMPTDPSSRLCGTCHIDTHDEWLTSAHGEGELSCIRCHNPHTNELKAGNMQDLCSTCHSEEGFYYGTTAHSQRGLLCTDCHLQVSGSPIGGGHGQRVHTFAVDLETCNQCHSEEMHLLNVEEESKGNGVTIINNPLNGGLRCESGGAPVNSEPDPAPSSPLNYLLIAAVGLTFGIAISPIAENWYERVVNRD